MGRLWRTPRDSKSPYFPVPNGKRSRRWPAQILDLYVVDAVDNEIDTLTPTWAWTASPGAFSYKLQISTVSNFSVIAEEVIQSETSYTALEDLDNGETYYARVAPMGVGGQSTWSNVVEVQILSLPGAVTDLAITGASGGTVGTLTPTITFTAAEGALSHLVQWSDDSFATVLGETTLTMPTVEYEHTVALANHYPYSWRVAGINAGGQGAWSDVLTLHVSVFTQEIASTLSNPDFDAWTGDNPDGWTKVGFGQPTDYIIQSAPDGNPGTGAAYFHRETANSLRIERSVTNGVWHQWRTVRSYNAGSNSTLEAPGGFVQYGNESNSRHIYRSRGTAIRFYIFALGDCALDTLRGDILTLNAEITSVADGTFEAHFTLPVSPVTGDEVLLLYRASGEQDYWRLFLRRNVANSAWDLGLDKVVSDSPTVVVSATGATGTPNAIRVITDGNDHSIYYSTDGGENWTQVSTTKTDSAMASNVGLRPVYSTVVTPIKVVRP